MVLYVTDIAAWGAVDGRLRAQIEARCSPARVARAGAMARQQDVLGVLAAGLLLRHTLGCTDDALCRSAQGKPYLPGGPEFSLTHGGTLAAVLVADGPCGVDAEALSRRVAHPERLFSPQELATGLSPAALWTRKEALFKADGRGLALFRADADVSGPTACLGGRPYVLTTQFFGVHAVSCAAGAAAAAPLALCLQTLLEL